MNKLSVTVMAIGLLLSASAMAQNNDNDTHKTNTPKATTTQSAPNTKTGDTGRLQNDRSSTNSSTKENSMMDGNAAKKASGGDDDQRSTRSSTRSKTRMDVGTESRERHHHGYREEFRFGHRHCRIITVRTRHHHHIVVRHIRRCYR